MSLYPIGHCVRPPTTCHLISNLCSDAIENAIMLFYISASWYHNAMLLSDVVDQAIGVVISLAYFEGLDHVIAVCLNMF
ncbi:unnamed protein product [Soboliphyme baturini]|uniref:Na_H_Exchanger domain-containing protein n=1 Tax=Soboliphyme baturini TaxID=241478 RepID=A0A183IP50_9BILA|nr:unnamed protein product [Soboliphyme baturini]